MKAIVTKDYVTIRMSPEEWAALEVNFLEPELPRYNSLTPRIGSLISNLLRAVANPVLGNWQEPRTVDDRGRPL